MSGLLYPAYQKFYSALHNLERFDKEANFFDNISAIDAFFTEYRNITFVMQASLAHTEFLSVYEENRDKYLTDHWFVEKRNETIKQKPFDLIKEILINLYLPFGGFTVSEKKYSVKNDEPLETLLSELKTELSKIDKHEVCFSVSFFFHEIDSDIDLLNKLLQGISSMKIFMNAMETEIGEECPLCNQLKAKINEIHITDVPLDFLSVNDYTYYPDNDYFDRAERVSMMLGIDGKKVANHRPITEMTDSKYFNYDGTVFGNFTLSHVIIQKIQKDCDIMPVIVVIYDDGTYDLDAFATNMKTTMYRKINETAQLIEKNNVLEICYMSLYTNIAFNDKTPKTSLERIEQAKSEFLVFASIDKNLNEKEYVFDRKYLGNAQYIRCIMQNGLNNSLNVTAINMFPIKYAFDENLKKSN